MELSLDIGSQSAIDLGQRLETILRRGHLYQDVVASDNSNVHNSDRIYITYNVTYNTSSSHGCTPWSTDQLLPDATSDTSAQYLSRLKPKRAVDDIEEVERKRFGNNRMSLGVALTSLGDFSKTMRDVEQG